MTDVVIPEGIWSDDKPGVLTSWLYEDGAEVAKGDLIAEVMSEKTQFEIEAPASGRLQIKVQAEEEVNIGDVIAVIS